MWGAVAGIVKGVLGASQMIRGEEGLAGLNRPEYERPTEIGQMLALSRQEYADPAMPGQGAAQDRLDMQTQTGFNQAKISGNTMAAIASLNAQSQAGQQNLATASSQQRMQDLQAYKAALTQSAQYTDQEFQMNEFAPFADKSQEYRDMIGAGTKNVYGSLTDLGGIGDAMTSQALDRSNGGQVQNQDTSDLYSQYNKTASPTSTDSSFNLDAASNMTNPNAQMPGYTWNSGLGRWQN